MDLTVGTIVEGKIKSITKFGAFVALDGNRTGMVHISEIAHSYVSDIHEHLTEGQDVKVMIISIDEAGKINLSIKRTQEPPARPQNDRFPPRGNQGERPQGNRPQFDRGTPQGNRPQYDRPPQSNRPRPQGGFNRSAAPKEPQTFDDMLKQFMQDSDSKISSIKQYSDHKNKKRR